jgi:hypothetical protein
VSNRFTDGLAWLAAVRRVNERSSLESSVQSLLEHFVEASVGAAQILPRPFLWDEFGG